MKLPKILIADDEPAIATGLGAILEGEGYAVDAVTDGQKALERLADDSYGVVLADLKMPKLDGMALLNEMRARQSPTQVFIVTGAGSVDLAVDAIKQGAYDFIEKPLNAERLTKLKALIPKALEKYSLQEKNRELETRLEGLTHYGELVGQSDAMRSVYEMIDRVAPSTASVLILGESGTGKELVANAIHRKSERAKGPFFALNCAALPKEILENELFGHEKGAFTGSTNEKPGAFEMASGGTIFLDEVAEMSPDIQVKLLRALESRMVRRLGGKKEIPVDIRIVAATNKDLAKALTESELREDLYYRLAVVELDLPPLRERGGDVPLLAKEFLARFAKQNGKRLDGFEDDAMGWINAYHWPGNVRELKNAVEKAVIMARGTRVSLSDITSRRHRMATGEYPAVVSVPMGSTLADARRQLVLQTFAASNGDLDGTAKKVGMSVADVRTELQSLLERRGGDGGDGDAAPVGSRGSDARAGGAPAGDAAPAPASEPALDEAPPAAATNGASVSAVKPAAAPVVVPEGLTPIGKPAGAKSAAGAKSRKTH